jgi:hypothetical protein
MQMYPMPIIIVVTPRPEWVTPVPFTADNVLALAIATAIFLAYIAVTIGIFFVGLRWHDGESWLLDYVDCTNGPVQAFRKFLGLVVIAADVFQVLFLMMCCFTFGG